MSREENTDVNEPSSEQAAAKPRFPDLPQAITSFGAALVDQTVYVYGGHHGEAHHYSQAGQSGELLGLNLNKPSAWRVVASGPKLQGLAMVSHRGKLYRVGGFTARNEEGQEHDLWSVADFTRFDPRTGGWDDLPPMPAPRSSFDAAMIGDTLYVVGGWLMQGEKETQWRDDAYSVDLTQSPLQWERLPKPGFQRRALSVGAIGGKLYVIGGIASDGKVTTRSAVYDPHTATWSEGPKLPGDDMEGFGSACFPADGELLVSTAAGQVLRLSDDGDSWQAVQQMHMGRFFHRMLPIDRRRLIVIGGASMKQGPYSETEVVDLGPK